jgi:hypothetical protein
MGTHSVELRCHGEAPRDPSSPSTHEEGREWTKESEKKPLVGFAMDAGDVPPKSWRV